MSRKIITLAAVLAILAAFSSCGEVEDSSANSSEATSSVAQSSAESSEQSSETEQSSQQDESEASESSEAAESQPEQEDLSYVDRIDGVWYIDGDIDAAFIYIDNTGSFTAYYADSNVEAVGKVKHEKTENDNEEYRFALYTEDGEPYLSFADGGTGMLDFVTDSGVRYVLMSGEGGFADDGRGNDGGENSGDTDSDKQGAYELFVGDWYCGRAQLCISATDSGEFLGEVIWGDSASSYVKWEYMLTFNSESKSMVCKEKATKTYFTTDENGKESASVLYKDGSGSFYAKDGVLTWEDNEENIGEDMEFERDNR
ncbi:MAG: hypothetical protein ACI4JA_10235 [Oscillospiraceae bacterium]